MFNYFEVSLKPIVCIRMLMLNKVGCHIEWIINWKCNEGWKRVLTLVSSEVIYFKNWHNFQNIYFPFITAWIFFWAKRYQVPQYMVLNFLCRICSYIAPGVGNDALLSLSSILRIKKILIKNVIIFITVWNKCKLIYK